MSRRNYINALLVQWANTIYAELDRNDFNSKTVISRVMEYGPDGANIKGTIPIPNYWPDHHLRAINDAVFGLPVKYRNVIVAIYLLGQTKYEASKTLGCAYNTVIKCLEEAENNLSNSLNN